MQKRVNESNGGGRRCDVVFVCKIRTVGVKNIFSIDSFPDILLISR